MKNLFGGDHFKEDLTVFDKSLFLRDTLALFRHQAEANPLYKSYLEILSVNPAEINEICKIPFLPVSFFKSHTIQTGEFVPEFCFESSGTTTSINSKHYIKEVSFYLKNAEENFNEFYGDLSSYCILALLPSYLERQNSSLVCMVEHFIKKTGHPLSGFFLNDHHALQETLQKLEDAGQPTILFGVTFALIDFAIEFPMKLEHTIIVETGGMKGRRKEMTRQELHSFLTKNLGVKRIHAEYGMTELQSQAYSQGDGIFKTPSSMKVLLRALDDPFEICSAESEHKQTGVINVIDLANKDSIAFIATDDLGKFLDNGSFEVTGRIDNSDIRGCSLLSI